MRTARPLLLSLLTLPAIAHAGTAYDFTARGFAQNNPPQFTSHYFVEDGKVHLVAADGKQSVIVKDKTIYMLDATARTYQSVANATLDEVSANLAASTQRLRETFSKDRPERRAGEADMAEALIAQNEKLRKPEPSDYTPTGRSESVGGLACHIWERSENGIKRREICVAPVDAVPGGADILAGMKSLSELFMGSVYALGLSLGMSPWWASIESLHGVPLLVREIDPTGTRTILETTLTGIHVEAKNPSLFEIPEGYQRKANPFPASAPAATPPP